MPKYLLVKAYVGFADRLQALSHAIDYAAKHDRILCVDWRDAIWSDGIIDFATYFDTGTVPTISFAELQTCAPATVWPVGWSNQFDRKADARFIYGKEYANPLEDKEYDADLLVYASTGHRTFHWSNIYQLRIKQPYRQRIVAELERYARFEDIVHLRGTDRVKAADYDGYLAETYTRMAAVDRQAEVLVVSDCLPLVELFRKEFPNAVLRTPNLEALDPKQGTHFQKTVSKEEMNLQMLIDFFLLMYTPRCYHDPKTLFGKMARFIRDGSYQNILGYDRA